MIQKFRSKLEGQTMTEEQAKALQDENERLKDALSIAEAELIKVSESECTGGWDSCGEANHRAGMADIVLENIDKALKGE